MVKPFNEWPGIQSVISGYTGGHKENPSYQEVKSGLTGHVEAVQITFDPAVFPYQELLDIYWHQIDPTDDEGQFQDRGSSYRTAIFYHSDEQKKIAELSRNALETNGKFDKPIVTRILPAQAFYPAEEYHQDFYKKSADAYHQDRTASGRDEFIKEHWKTPEK